MDNLIEEGQKFLGKLSPGEFILYFYIFIFFLTSLIPGNWYIGLGVFVAIVSVTYENFYTYVPAVMAFAMHNKLSGKIRGIGPGWKTILPWEEKYKEISLEVISAEFEETYNSKDGADMSTKIGFEYKPDPNHIMAFISLSKSVLERGIKGALSSCASGIIAKNPAQYNRENVKEISKDLISDFEDVEVQNLDLDVQEEIEEQKDNTDKESKKIEKALGVNVVLAQFEDINIPKKLRQAKMAESVAETNDRTAKIYQGEGEEGSDNHISRKEAMNYAFLSQEGANTKKEMYDIEGLENFGTNVGKAIGTAMAGVMGISNKKPAEDE